MKEYNARHPQGVDCGPRQIDTTAEESIINIIPSSFSGGIEFKVAGEFNNYFWARKNGRSKKTTQLSEDSESLEDLS